MNELLNATPLMLILVVGVVGAVCLIAVAADTSFSLATGAPVDWTTSGYLSIVGAALMGLSVANTPWLLEWTLRGGV